MRGGGLGEERGGRSNEFRKRKAKCCCLVEKKE